MYEKMDLSIIFHLILHYLPQRILFYKCYNYLEVVTLFISPMLLHKTEQPFEDNDFITELKLDGIRLIFSKFDDQIKLYTRHKNDLNVNYLWRHW
ncbi:hypothetical protein BS1321_03590 [Peribacillus simplex NBRC 15720 = DSM 1321]|uniref:ATP-dependent DNA ligase family profile domain-containing protein n=1 Tax=Peribacillus simplex NBRC 15720 = DSM 1321 TaxID=1349754 RepID=A0A223ED01_9BACI|nr:hypothetical protein BS1321_03590 [Peribacillus simplex NBRC 15720 = DSM 1321]